MGTERPRHGDRSVTVRTRRVDEDTVVVEQHFRRLGIDTRTGYVVAAGAPLGTGDDGALVRESADVVIRVVHRDATGWYVAYRPLAADVRSAFSPSPPIPPPARTP